ncbi:MAG: SPOR domain-containing protein [Bacteroidales bacterium]|nr:SPOR domain-containing protein [Bacteroidales bacterium]
MKSKFFLFGLIATFALTMGACKSKQSQYQNVYEQARQKAIEEQQEENIEEMVPVEKPKPVLNDKFQVEKVTSVDGNGIKEFSVVIGSFINKTNAESLKERMTAQGYNVVLAQNERDMYRVIIATYDNKADAIYERDRVKTKFAPEFNDAWLLQQGN